MASIDTSAGRPRNVLRRMGVEARRIRLVGHRENTHWVADGADRRVVLRRHAAGRSIHDVTYEHELLVHLAKLGWPVAAPLAPPLVSDSVVWSMFPYLSGRRPSPRLPPGSSSNNAGAVGCWPVSIRKWPALSELDSAQGGVGRMRASSIVEGNNPPRWFSAVTSASRPMRGESFSRMPPGCTSDSTRCFRTLRIQSSFTAT